MLRHILAFISDTEVKTMKSLYISDLDGTMLNSGGKLSIHSEQTINALLDRGMLFTVATARSITTARTAIDGLKLKLPIVVYNGGFILDPVSDKILLSSAFTEDEKNRISNLIDKMNASALVHGFIRGTEYVSWLTEKENAGIAYYKESRKGDRRLRPVQTAAELYEGSVVYVSLIGEKSEMQAFYDASHALSFTNIIIQREVYRPEYWVELMPKRVSKAEAVLKLKRLCGCDSVVTFGDAINDLPMFQASDACYAVLNAVEELKQAATGVIGANDSDGVATWLAENALDDMEQNPIKKEGDS
jgi:Cof subfamily protein (haloacid dehalogenase superfamily)